MFEYKYMNDKSWIKKSKSFVFWALYILNESMFFGDNVSV